MPPRRRPTPKSKRAQLVCELIAKDECTLTKACELAGLNRHTVWMWLKIAKGEFGSGRPPSQQHIDACIRFSHEYNNACEERDETRVQSALQTIRRAATEGFASSKIRRKLVAGQVVEEIREVSQGQPDWHAAGWTAERLRPERYSKHSKVELSGGVQLRPGEADQVAAECTDEEAEAIDRGDMRVLAAVVTRVRGRSD